MTISHSDSSRLLPPEENGRPPIIRVDENRLEEAMTRLLMVGGEADRGRARRFINFSRENGIRLNAVWSEVNADGRIVRTVLAVPNAGRTAMVFASRPAVRAESRALALVIDHAVGELGAMGVHLAQALLDPAELLERQTYLHAGFTELARLSYLERPLPRRRGREAVTWPDGVSAEPYRDELEPHLLRVLEASYEGTLDCPGLLGLRETSDILAGHKGTGAFDPALWTLLFERGEACGALLLNPAPHHRSIELVYLGLAPRARGRGLGRLLLRHGLGLLASRAERVVSLAVDEQNAPALALYRGAGFSLSLRRIALVRSLRAPARA